MLLEKKDNWVCTAVFLVNPLMPDWEFEEVTSLSYLMLEDPVSNHGYWQTKGSIGLNSHSDKSSDSSAHLPFFPVLQHDSDLAHHFHSPSHSQLLVEPKPSCPWSGSAVWMTRRCSERHWTAQCGGASLKSSRFFSLSSALCKSPTTPSVTSLLPCAPTPVTSSHSGSLSCSPFHAPLLCKEEMLLSHNSLMAWSVLSTSRRLWVVMYSVYKAPGHLLLWI